MQLFASPTNMRILFECLYSQLAGSVLISRELACLFVLKVTLPHGRLKSKQLHPVVVSAAIGKKLGIGRALK